MDTTIKLLPATCKVKVERVSRKRRLLVQHGYRPYQNYPHKRELPNVLCDSAIWINESGVHTKLLSKPTIALPSGIVESAPVSQDDKAISFQSTLFGDTTIQLGLLAQDKVVTPAKSHKVKSAQSAMFRDSETIQFGVTKVNPTMPIPEDCAIKLVLQSEPIPGPASELTLPLFQDDKPDKPTTTGVISDTTDWCAYPLNVHKQSRSALGDGWNGIVFPEECTYEPTPIERPKHKYVPMTKKAGDNGY